MNARLKNQAFFQRFNRIFFPLLYLRHWNKKTAVVKVGEGNRFKVRVNTSDILLIWEIWKFRVYEDARVSIRPGDVVVDIGAHIGVFAVWAAQRAQGGRVYAYEASRANYELLVENQRLNGAPNLHAENLAVFDQPGRHDFYRPGGNGALGSLLQDQRAEKEVVTATTLPDLLADRGLERIDYLKMDVEGAEYPILLHCPAETLDRVSNVVLEYHELEGAPWGPRDLEDRLRACGFQVSREPGLWGQTALFGTGMIVAWRV